MTRGRRSTIRKEDAELAWKRTLGFLREHLT
jgi:hypothetical protein